MKQWLLGKENNEHVEAHKNVAKTICSGTKKDSLIALMNGPGDI